MSSIADSLYPHLPVALQNAACWAYGRREARVRYGAEFERRAAELAATDRLGPAEIEAYQDERLRALVRHVWERVPFHRERMQALRLTPDDIRGRADLPKLPVLTKEDVRRELPRLLAAGADPRELVIRHTSGTTGKSLTFYSTRASIAFQWALWWRHRGRFGFDRETWSANFTGKLVVPPEQSRPPYWRRAAPLRQALLGMHHMTREHAPAIAAFLDREGLPVWTGYPSVIHAFVLAARDAGVRLARGPRLVVTGAESVLAAQRRDIEAFTGARLTDQYGMSEGCGNASQCERGAYHEDFEFGILEAHEPEPAGDGRVRARVLATGFACPSFPFIRYEVGDVAVWEPPPAGCPCGRSSRVLGSIEGRLEDYVLTPEGRRIMRFDYVFKESASVRECQVVQARPGAITLRVVRRAEYTHRDEEHLAREVARWVSPRLEVEFEYVDAIEREANGKFRAVKSLLGPGAAAGGSA